jgi:hypothetical protein
LVETIWQYSKKKSTADRRKDFGEAEEIIMRRSAGVIFAAQSQTSAPFSEKGKNVPPCKQNGGQKRSTLRIAALF